MSKRFACGTGTLNIVPLLTMIVELENKFPRLKMFPLFLCREAGGIYLACRTPSVIVIWRVKFWPTLLPGPCTTPTEVGVFLFVGPLKVQQSEAVFI